MVLINERGILVGVDSWRMTRYQEVRILYEYAVLKESNINQKKWASTKKAHGNKAQQTAEKELQHAL